MVRKSTYHTWPGGWDVRHQGGTATYTRLPAAPFEVMIGTHVPGGPPAEGQASATPGGLA